MAIVRPLHRSIRVVSLGAGLDGRDRQAHDLGKGLADLVLCELVFGGELEDLRQCGPLFGVEIFRGHIFRDVSYLFGDID